MSNQNYWHLFDELTIFQTVMLLFGYVWTIVFGCLPIMVLNVARGVQQISLEKLEILSIYKAKITTRLKIFFMEIIPSILLGGRVTLSFAIVISVVCEMVFTPRSGWALGALARDAEMNFDTPTFYACVLIIGFFGYILNVLLKMVTKQ